MWCDDGDVFECTTERICFIFIVSIVYECVCDFLFIVSAFRRTAVPSGCHHIRSIPRTKSSTALTKWTIKWHISLIWHSKDCQRLRSVWTHWRGNEVNVHVTTMMMVNDDLCWWCGKRKRPNERNQKLSCDYLINTHIWIFTCQTLMRHHMCNTYQTYIRVIISDTWWTSYLQLVQTHTYEILMFITHMKHTHMKHIWNTHMKHTHMKYPITHETPFLNHMNVIVICK